MSGINITECFVFISNSCSRYSYKAILMDSPHFCVWPGALKMGEFIKTVSRSVRERLLCSLCSGMTAMTVQTC